MGFEESLGLFLIYLWLSVSVTLELGFLKSSHCLIWALQNLAVPMDASTSGTSSVQYHSIAEQPIAATIVNSTFQRQVRHCFGNATPGEFPLSANPSIVLHATCSFFRQPANFAPDNELSLAELAALDMLKKSYI
ncbi:hypothetical protein H5410_026377 [Solanum commersonii]|uniref:Uncharacterized protein n=1 Tax=Solanum commersonii TaxID=4109 RepID=A0A9J5YYG5_SOLCO|nr:hypothetical protein H5410_026377 [Solanum commersonii]